MHTRMLYLSLLVQTPRKKQFSAQFSKKRTATEPIYSASPALPTVELSLRRWTLLPLIKSFIALKGGSRSNSQPISMLTKKEYVPKQGHAQSPAFGVRGRSIPLPEPQLFSS